jgi:hypothetical protein
MFKQRMRHIAEEGGWRIEVEDGESGLARMEDAGSRMGERGNFEARTLNPEL